MKRRILALLMSVLLLLPLFAHAEETLDEAALEAQYQAAMALYDAQDYLAAQAAFEALGDYSRSKVMAKDCVQQQKRVDYRRALALYKEGQYYEAREIFEALGKYDRSKTYKYYCDLEILAIEYQQARDLYDAGDYQNARDLFASLDGYRESDDWVEKCDAGIAQQELDAYEAKWYDAGVALMDAGAYAEARDAFIQAGDHLDATDRMYEAFILAGHQEIDTLGKAALKAGQYHRAIMLFSLNEDAMDGHAQAAAAEAALPADAPALTQEEQNALDFEKAFLLKKLWRIEESNQILLALGDYRNASQLVAEVTEKMFTASQLRDDATTPLSEVFVAPDGSRHQYRMYRGVPRWVQARAFCELLGGHLATLTTPEENEFVHSFMWDSGFTTAYFGLMDEERDRTWVWVTGEPVEYTNWDSNEPSYSTYERYGMYFYKHTKGTWNDSHFYEHWENQEWSYICEWDLDARQP